MNANNAKFVREKMRIIINGQMAKFLCHSGTLTGQAPRSEVIESRATRCYRVVYPFGVTLPPA